MTKQPITAYPFYDARLTPMQNKFLEMWRNGMQSRDIAEEMEVDAHYVRTVLSKLRAALGDEIVPRRNKYKEYVFKPRVTQVMAHVHAYWFHLHVGKRMSVRAVAKYVNRSVGTVSGAIWRLKNGRERL